MTIHIHVGANVPGYLPEGDVMCFDSVEGALDALKQELNDQQDFYSDQGADQPNPEEDGAWHDVWTNVENALTAIEENSADAAFVSEGRAAWIFSPPQGADMHHWAVTVEGDRQDCETFQDQEV